MTRFNQPLAICLLVLATFSLSCSFCQAQGDDRSLEDLKFKYGVERERYGKPLKALDASYKKNLETLEEEAASAGKLNHVLLVREELALLGKPGHAKAEGFAELARLQQIYGTESEKLTAKRDERIEELMGKYMDHLEAVKKDLTRAKKIDEAVAVGNEIKIVSAERAVIIAARKKANPGIAAVAEADESEFEWEALAGSKVLSSEKSPGQVGVESTKTTSVIYIGKGLPSRFVITGEYYLNGPWGGFALGLDPRSSDFLSVYSFEGGATRIERVLGGVRKLIQEEKVPWKAERWTDFELVRELDDWKVKIGSKTFEIKMPEGVSGRYLGLVSYPNSSISVRKLKLGK